MHINCTSTLLVVVPEPGRTRTEPNRTVNESYRTRTEPNRTLNESYRTRTERTVPLTNRTVPVRTFPYHIDRTRSY